MTLHTQQQSLRGAPDISGMEDKLPFRSALGISLARQAEVLPAVFHVLTSQGPGCAGVLAAVEAVHMQVSNAESAAAPWSQRSLVWASASLLASVAITVVRL